MFGGLGKLLKDVSYAILEEEDKKSQTPASTEGPDILTAAKLSQLKWFSTSQLAAIYKYGKVKTKIDDDPAAYSQLKWFTSEQLKAIFGEEGL